jgi:outer membrane protein assembly factor BamA
MKAQMTGRQALARFLILVGLVIPNYAPAATAPSSTAQSPTFRLAALKFTGLKLYSEAQLEKASGLQTGSPVTQSQLAAAVEKLSKSGAFQSVSFRYSTSGNSLNVEFDVTEVSRLLPCVFDNFIWFSDVELDKALRNRVPLYAGGVPESGTTTEEVRVALHDVIQAAGVPGDVAVIPSIAGLGQPVSAFVYSVTGVSMPIQSVRFTGNAAISSESLHTASSQIMGRDYSASFVSGFAAAGLVPLYRKQGYLRARFEQPEGTAISADNKGKGTVQEVAVTLSIAEGPEFYWEKAEWTGNRIFTAEELDRLLGMKPKEVANQEKIDAGLTAVKRAYDTRGFIEAAVQPKEILDDSARLTTYDVKVDEGAQFHLNAVHFQGLPEFASKELMKSWQLKPGDVFDASYPNTFVSQILPGKLKELGIEKARFTMNSKPEKQKAIVDFYIVFH